MGHMRRAPVPRCHCRCRCRRRSCSCSCCGVVGVLWLCCGCVGVVVCCCSLLIGFECFGWVLAGCWLGGVVGWCCWLVLVGVGWCFGHCMTCVYDHSHFYDMNLLIKTHADMEAWVRAAPVALGQPQPCPGQVPQLTDDHAAASFQQHRLTPVTKHQFSTSSRHGERG